MNSIFTAKLLQNLRNKKSNKGFTLIELLVVVIIIGVLAAVALPNLLAQVGKARESEGKTAVGTINRSQQSFHFESGTFAPAIAAGGLGVVTNDLGVAIASDYYALSTTGGGAGATNAEGVANPGAAPNGKTATANGVRGFGGEIAFDAASGLYGTVICQSKAIGASTTPTASATAASTCGSTDTLLK
jgi:type IV pilus assembly protein PilA